MIRIHKQYSKNVNAITRPIPHDSGETFNMGEIFATAMLAILSPVELFRTEDQSIINNTNAIVYNVGNEFDPARKRFDYRQKGFFEIYPDGTIYSTAGLIWREYGIAIVKKLDKDIDDEIALKVMLDIGNNLISDFDAMANSQSKSSFEFYLAVNLVHYALACSEGEDLDTRFINACKVADVVLRNEIKIAISLAQVRELPLKDQIETIDNTIIVMDQYVPGWSQLIHSSDHSKVADLLYVIFSPKIDRNCVLEAILSAIERNWRDQKDSATFDIDCFLKTINDSYDPRINSSINTDWYINAIPLTSDDWSPAKRPFPEEWRGLQNEDLQKASGVKTAVFCHTAGYFAIAKTKDGAIALAKKAINN